MKTEIGEQKPVYYKEYWPGQYHFFSHLEYVCGIPHALFLITTLKEKGIPNACFHSWSAFSGDSGGFYAIMSGLMQHTHTYKNIMRENEFCVNFLSAEYYDHCGITIKENEENTDEIAVAGLNAEASSCIKPPRIREAFLSLECTLESHTDLSGKGISSLIIGRVRRAIINEGQNRIETICGQHGFMFNLHSPKDPETGEGEVSALAELHVLKLQKG